MSNRSYKLIEDGIHPNFELINEGILYPYWAKRVGEEVLKYKIESIYFGKKWLECSWLYEGTPYFIGCHYSYLEEDVISGTCILALTNTINYENLYEEGRLRIKILKNGVLIQDKINDVFVEKKKKKKITNENKKTKAV